MYAKRLSTVRGSDIYLRDVITLNENSEGFIDYGEAKLDQTISGAIHNTEWLNEKVDNSSNGTYHIFVVAKIEATRVAKYSEQEVVITYDKDIFGTLTIKDRELVPLD
jgi:hypothetical protein